MVGEEEAPIARETVPSIYDLLGLWNLLEIFWSKPITAIGGGAPERKEASAKQLKQQQLLWAKWRGNRKAQRKSLGAFSGGDLGGKRGKRKWCN